MSQEQRGPGEGRDSKVDDWFGQSVERDRKLAEKLSDELDPDDAEAVFDEQSGGRSEQERRHGSSIDPDQGVAASHAEGAPGPDEDT